jgi:hypothetical protein
MTIPNTKRLASIVAGNVVLSTPRTQKKKIWFGLGPKIVVDEDQKYNPASSAHSLSRRANQKRHIGSTTNVVLKSLRSCREYCHRCYLSLAQDDRLLLPILSSALYRNEKNTRGSSRYESEVPHDCNFHGKYAVRIAFYDQIASARASCPSSYGYLSCFMYRPWIRAESLKKGQRRESRR